MAEPDTAPSVAFVTFVSWVDADGEAFDFETAIAGDTVVYSTWIAAEPTYSYDTVGDLLIYAYANGDYYDVVIEGTGEIPKDWETTLDFDKTQVLTATIGDGITSMAQQAFQSFTNMTTITIGSSLTSLGNYCIYNCSSLTTVVIESTSFSCTTTSVNGAASTCTVYLASSTNPSWTVNKIYYAGEWRYVDGIPTAN